MTSGPIHEAPARTGASSHPPALPEGLVFDDEPRPGSVHMERAAARFARTEDGDEPFAPALEWFTWDRPTVSLGRHESASGFDAAALAAAGVPLCERPTGGRAVFHVDEWTYVALVPLAHPTLGGSLATSTRALTRLVASALEDAYGLRCDSAVEVTAGSLPAAVPPTCFARSFGYELTVGGRKLMGSAQRRGRRALLQQGSLLVGPGHEAIVGFLGGRGDRGAVVAAEQSLRAVTTNLTALLGGRPEAAAFRRALAAAWDQALREASTVVRASGSGESAAAPLDRPGHPS
jgi:lipoate-protein ligase A